MRAVLGSVALTLALAAAVPAKGPGGSVLVLADAKEPGTRMVIAGRVWKSDGKTPAGAESVLVFQTDASGEYGSRPAITPPPRTRDARLSGYVRTDPEGRFEVRTIRPGPYRTGGTPAHVHFVVDNAGFELRFADDPLVGATERNKMATDGTFATVRPVWIDFQKVQHVTKDFRLPQRGNAR
jgi:protocatechuate 3,4-dioxygenase beta subunit